MPPPRPPPPLPTPSSSSKAASKTNNATAPRSVLSASSRPDVGVGAGATPITTTTPPLVPSLTRRLLFPHLPPSEPIPPILLPGTGSDELNAEIYEFIAFALRGFVTPWWSQITPRDKDFLPEITQILIHVVRELQTRLAKADLAGLLFSDIPTLITQHYRDYRDAQAKLGTSYASDAALPPVFHISQPHIAVSPEGSINDTYLRQAVELVMQACLPPKNWEALSERSIVREIIVKPVLGNILPKLAQPWFLHTIILNLIGAPRGPKPTIKPTPPPPPPSSGISFQAAVIFVLKAVQTISTLCLAAITFSQQTFHLINHVNAKPKPTGRHALARPAIDMLSEVLEMRTRAASSAILSTVEVGVGFSTPFLDRFIPHALNTQALTPARITGIVAQTKNVMFPNGYPGPSPVEPTREEQLLLREQLEMRLLDLVPSPIAPFLLGPTPSERQQTISAALEPLSSNACNAHLIVLIFDLLLVTLFPEMGVGVGEKKRVGDDVSVAEGVVASREPSSE